MSSTASGGGRGGPFCQFTVGRSEKGASVRHLRYIANRQAVRDGREGVWLQGFPDLLMEAPYVVLVQHLCDWAHWLEQEEIIRHRGKGEVRTYYQAILSFEVSLPSTQTKSLLAEWMQATFPLAQAAAFLHRNTQHLHSHVWIAARQTDGRKINLSARAYRQIDERWNWIYSQALNRDVREHLLKKGQTERFKALRREGKAREIELPARVGHFWHRAEFNERERQRLGVGLYDSNQTRVRGGESEPSKSTPPTTRGVRSPSFPEPGTTEEAHCVQQTLEDAQQAVSETERLHHDASRMARRQQQQQQPSLDPERAEREEPER